MIYVSFELPHNTGGCYHVSFVLGHRTDIVNPTENGILSDAIIVPAGKSQTLKVAFKTRGLDQLSYNFQNGNRVRNFVLFSYSFFIDGYSGLTIAIGSVLTLAFLMATTAKIDWSKRSGRSAVTPPAIPAQ